MQCYYSPLKDSACARPAASSPLICASEIHRTHGRPELSAGGDCELVCMDKPNRTCMQALMPRRLQQEGEGQGQEGQGQGDENKPSRLRGWKPRAHGYTTTIAMGLAAPLAIVVSRNFRVGSWLIKSCALVPANHMQH